MPPTVSATKKSKRIAAKPAQAAAPAPAAAAESSKAAKTLKRKKEAETEPAPVEEILAPSVAKKAKKDAVPAAKPVKAAKAAKDEVVAPAPAPAPVVQEEKKVKFDKKSKVKAKAVPAPTPAAEASAVSPEKTKEAKSKTKAVKPEKEKKEEEAKVVEPPTPTPTPAAPVSILKKTTKGAVKKTTAVEPVPTAISRPRNTKVTAVKAKKEKTKVKAKAPEPVEEEEVEQKDEEDEAMEDDVEEVPEADADEDEEDGHLHGFSTDDDDSSDDDAMDDEPTEFDMGSLPTIAKDDATVKRKLEKAKQQNLDDRGVLFLGRLPHGFYEDQLKAYFSQFGAVTRLRVSRNKKTGKSKHYGFIEFESSAVAQIVAETMDNYLLMGHIMRCKVIPKDQVHPELWVGANRKWRTVPVDRLTRAEHDKRRTESEQSKATRRLLKRQRERQAKLEKAGIKYNFDGAGYKKPATV